jgi:hypothetical protein
LNPARYVCEISSRDALVHGTFQGATDTSIWCVRVRVGVGYVAIDPANVRVVDDSAPGLPQEKKPLQLRNAFLQL